MAGHFKPHCRRCRPVKTPGAQHSVLGQLGAGLRVSPEMLMAVAVAARVVGFDGYAKDNVVPTCRFQPAPQPSPCSGEGATSGSMPNAANAGPATRQMRHSGITVAPIFW